MWTCKSNVTEKLWKPHTSRLQSSGSHTQVWTGRLQSSVKLWHHTSAALFNWPRQHHIKDPIFQDTLLLHFTQQATHLLQSIKIRTNFGSYTFSDCSFTRLSAPEFHKRVDKNTHSEAVLQQKHTLEPNTWTPREKVQKEPTQKSSRFKSEGMALGFGSRNA